MWVSNLVQNKNYRNSAEKPLQNTVKNHCEKAVGNVTAKPKQKLWQNLQEYANGMQNSTKNEEPLLVYVNGYHCI